ncbi:MAG: hypothetical protein AAF446_07265 [Pseudomonadota bacterium]
MENRPVMASDGTRVGAYKGQPRNIKASFEKIGNYAKISADFYIGKSKKFQRGIYKIAVSALAYYVGADEMYKPKYNAIRNYVRNGKGKRHIIFLQESDFEHYEHEFNKPYVSQSNNYIITFRLACARMIVDLSENESELPKMIETLLAELGETGWTVIPLGLIKE